MFLSGVAVIVRQLLPFAILLSRPEEIGTRFFFGQLAGAFSNGWIDRDVVVCALKGEAYRIRHVRLGGVRTNIVYAGWLTDFVNQCLGAQFVFA